MIGFACAHCGTGLRVKEKLAGKKVKCPKCGRVSAVPAEAPSSPTRGSAVSGSVAEDVKTRPQAVPASSHDAPTLSPEEDSGGGAGPAKAPPGDTVPGVGN